MAPEDQDIVKMPLQLNKITTSSPSLFFPPPGFDLLPGTDGNGQDSFNLVLPDVPAVTAQPLQEGLNPLPDETGHGDVPVPPLGQGSENGTPSNLPIPVFPSAPAAQPLQHHPFPSLGSFPYRDENGNYLPTAYDDHVTYGTPMRRDSLDSHGSSLSSPQDVLPALAYMPNASPMHGKRHSSKTARRCPGFDELCVRFTDQASQDYLWGYWALVQSCANQLGMNSSTARKYERNCLYRLRMFLNGICMNPDGAEIGYEELKNGLINFFLKEKQGKQLQRQFFFHPQAAMMPEEQNMLMWDQSVGYQSLDQQQPVQGTENMNQDMLMNQWQLQYEQQAAQGMECMHQQNIVPEQAQIALSFHALCYRMALQLQSFRHQQQFGRVAFEQEQRELDAYSDPNQSLYLYWARQLEQDHLQTHQPITYHQEQEDRQSLSMPFMQKDQSYSEHAVSVHPGQRNEEDRSYWILPPPHFMEKDHLLSDDWQLLPNRRETRFVSSPVVPMQRGETNHQELSYWNLPPPQPLFSIQQDQMEKDCVLLGLRRPVSPSLDADESGLPFKLGKGPYADSYDLVDLFI